jgi:DNA mismatch endonuclease (patch repair protein)
MVDRLSREHRSWNMSRIRGKDTKPELAVRSALHRAGYRFRLHRKYLPGQPDIVLLKYRTVVFVHGCFWHRHKGCKFAYAPKSRVAFWNEKFLRNVDRDRRNANALRRLGWRVITIWECQAARPASWLRRLPTPQKK